VYEAMSLGLVDCVNSDKEDGCTYWNATKWLCLERIESPTCADPFMAVLHVVNELASMPLRVVGKEGTWARSLLEDCFIPLPKVKRKTNQ
jgi:hypothetical protein